MKAGRDEVQETPRPGCKQAPLPTPPHPPLPRGFTARVPSEVQPAPRLEAGAVWGWGFGQKSAVWLAASSSSIGRGGKRRLGAWGRGHISKGICCHFHSLGTHLAACLGVGGGGVGLPGLWVLRPLFPSLSFTTVPFSRASYVQGKGIEGTPGRVG